MSTVTLLSELVMAYIGWVMSRENACFCYAASWLSADPYAATHCNTLQHTATHRNTPQHTATNCSVFALCRPLHCWVWPHARVEFLKSQLTTEFSIWNDYRADLWEICSDGKWTGTPLIAPMVSLREAWGEWSGRDWEGAVRGVGVCVNVCHSCVRHYTCMCVTWLV